MKFNGGADHVRNLVCRGTLTSLIPSALGVGKDGAVAFDQMVPGSDFLRALNDGATNVRIQDQLPDNRVTHPGLAFDPAVQNGIEDALRGEPIDLTR